jgi:hypothetical protein
MTQLDRDFKLLAFFPADHAEAMNGKIYVHGGYWNRLNFPSFPQLVNLTLVAVLNVPFAKYQADHKFSIGMRDLDGNALPLDVQGNFRVGANPTMEYGDPTVMPIAVPVIGLPITHPADYVFTFSVDDTPLGDFAFRAVQIQMPLMFHRGPPDPPSESEAS